MVWELDIATEETCSGCRLHENDRNVEMSTSSSLTLTVLGLIHARGGSK